MHASSGTRGKPTVVGYTRTTWRCGPKSWRARWRWQASSQAWSLHNAYGYGLFTGGLGFHMGAELMGCTVVPISGGFTQRQVLMLRTWAARCCARRPRTR